MEESSVIYNTHSSPASVKRAHHSRHCVTSHTQSPFPIFSSLLFSRKQNLNANEQRLCVRVCMCVFACVCIKICFLDVVC